MIFRGESTNQDICSIANRFAGLPLNDTTRYPLAEKVQDANIGMRLIWTWILEVYGGWIPDDSNRTDLPEYLRELTANQSFFELPDAEQTLFGVEVLDSGSNWRKLHKITLEEILDTGSAEAEFMDTAGEPMYYRPLADGFKIYPQCDTTRASGLAVIIGREHSLFTTSTTGIAPGFVSNFHEALAVFMALSYCEVEGRDKRAARLRKRWDGDEDNTGREGGYKKAIKMHYKSRFRQNQPPRLRRNTDYVDGMVS